VSYGPIQRAVSMPWGVGCRDSIRVFLMASHTTHSSASHMNIAKFNTLTITTTSGKAVDPSKCIVTNVNAAETEKVKPISKKEMKERFGLTAGEADWAHRQILCRFKAAMAASFSMLVASETMGGVGMSTTKGGKHVFELREMKDAKPAKGSSVDVGAKIAAFKAAGMSAEQIVAALQAGRTPIG